MKPSVPNAEHYRTLDAAKIVATIDRLKLRIEERFPTASLSRIATELSEIAGESMARVELIQERNIPLRLMVGILIVAAGWLLYNIIPFVDFSKTNADNIYTVLQGVEASMNILVLTGALMLFLFTVEVG